MAYALATEVAIGPEELGVAIKHGSLGSHLGIVYNDENDVARILHLGWHKLLLVDGYPQSDWLASTINLPAIASSQAVALIQGMAELYGNKREPEGLDYGINLFAGQGSIDSNGRYAPGADCDGFTCASIIAEILHKVGFPLVDLPTWPAAPKNEAWARAIVCMLRATGTSAEHVEKVEANITGLRLRPEEVAAAAELPPEERPVGHEVIQDRADQIIAQIEELCGPAPEPNSRIRRCVITYREELALLEANETAANDVAVRDTNASGVQANDGAAND
ncbi:hypothetical protein [Burkholderia cepacia]|uniref:hypothetical protein n=1 Tax=Burkholderia cepacia TaxID=292 RepID=UPI000F59F649|nr:hypothetical protein [Burkholderia cepacia]